jgi:hypothetical protein
MTEKERNGGQAFAFVLAALAGLSRLPWIPRPLNLSAMGGVGLFAGGRLGVGTAYALSLAVMVLTDAAWWWHLGYDAMYSPLHISRVFVYPSILLYVFIGRTLVNTESPLRIGAASVLGSVQFFLITNFGAWLEIEAYPKTLEGLGLCYLAGLPFQDLTNPVGWFGWTLLGDLGFTTALFGVHALHCRAHGLQPVGVERNPNT